CAAACAVSNVANTAPVRVKVKPASTTTGVGLGVAVGPAVGVGAGVGAGAGTGAGAGLGAATVGKTGVLCGLWPGFGDGPSVPGDSEEAPARKAAPVATIPVKNCRRVPMPVSLVCRRAVLSGTQCKRSTNLSTANMYSLMTFAYYALVRRSKA